jgi:mannose-6-phosphate isomerase-like protein (cupin superfamily)
VLPPDRAAWLSDLPKAGLPGRAIEPAGLPVVACTGALPALAAPASLALIQILVDVAPQLRWAQTYGRGEVSSTFLDRYGWSELLGLRGPYASRRLALGFLLLGPEVEYPPHAHEAEEIYIVLAGTALWWRKGGTWDPCPPMTVIHHPSGLPHAMRTRNEPLLALYLWRGAIVSPARLDG